jgi:hypothetical protein
MDPVSDALAVAGWLDIDMFAEAHPEALERPFGELASHILANPNPERGDAQ